MYIVGLGSNLGSRLATFEAALALLDASAGCKVIARSLVYESEPLGPPQPLYLNAAVAAQSALAPEAMLQVLLEVETQLGRVRTERWGPRVIDLDLLWGVEPCATPQLTLPHAGLAQRWFALAPLLDVASELAVQSATDAASRASFNVAEVLSARFTPELAALGGAPVVGATFSNPVRARIIHNEPESRVWIEVEGPLEEAVAALLVGVGRVLAAREPIEGAPSALELRCAPLTAHVVRSAPDIASIATAALELASAGLSIEHASIGENLSSVRLIGTQAQLAGANRGARLEAIEAIEAIEARPSGVRLCVACRLY